MKAVVGLLFAFATLISVPVFSDETPNIDGSWQVTRAKGGEEELKVMPGEMLTQFSKGTYTSSVNGRLSKQGLKGAKGTFKQMGFDIEVSVDGQPKSGLGKVIEATKERLVIHNKDLKLELEMSRISDEDFKKLSEQHAKEIAELPKDE